MLQILIYFEEYFLKIKMDFLPIILNVIRKCSHPMLNVSCVQFYLPTSRSISGFFEVLVFLMQKLLLLSYSSGSCTGRFTRTEKATSKT